MIGQLRPDIINDYYEYGFNWDDIIEDKRQQNRVFRYLNSYFKIGLGEYDNNSQKQDNSPIFSKSEDDSTIKIETQTKNIVISFEKTRDNVEVILKEDNIKKILSLKLKINNEIYFPKIKSNGSFSSFMNMFYRKRPYYLDVIYETKIEKNIILKDRLFLKDKSLESNLNYETQTIDVFENGYFIRKPLKDYLEEPTYDLIQKHKQTQHRNDVQNFREETKKYFLNIRGLILYILGELKLSQKDSSKNNSKYRKSKYRKKISKVLENLSQNYPLNFPFLYNYTKFKELFDNLAKNKNLEYYEVEVLIIIAKELKTHILFDEQFSNLDIDSNNNALINLSITKKYFSEMSYYFGYLSQFLDDEKKKEFIPLFRDYQKHMLTLIEKYLIEEQKSIRNLLEDFESNNLLIS